MKNEFNVRVPIFKAYKALRKCAIYYIHIMYIKMKLKLFIYIYFYFKSFRDKEMKYG